MEAPCPQAPVTRVGAPASALGHHQPGASPAAVHLPAPSPLWATPCTHVRVRTSKHLRAHVHPHTRVRARALVHSRAPAQHARLKTSTRSRVARVSGSPRQTSSASHVHARTGYSWLPSWCPLITRPHPSPRLQGSGPRERGRRGRGRGRQGRCGAPRGSGGMLSRRTGHLPGGPLSGQNQDGSLHRAPHPPPWGPPAIWSAENRTLTSRHSAHPRLLTQPHVSPDKHLLDISCPAPGLSA